VNNNASSHLQYSQAYIGFDRVNHSRLIFNATKKSPGKIGIYVDPCFFLGPAVAPHFLNSRIATV